MLLLERDLSYATGLARYLKLEGHHASVAANDSAAGIALVSARWDLCLISGEVGSGEALRLARRTRELQPGAMIGLLGSDTLKATIPAPRPLGVDAVIPKPWTRQEFATLLERAQGRRANRCSPDCFAPA